MQTGMVLSVRCFPSCVSVAVKRHSECSRDWNELKEILNGLISFSFYLVLMFRLDINYIHFICKMCIINTFYWSRCSFLSDTLLNSIYYQTLSHEFVIVGTTNFAFLIKQVWFWNVRMWLWFHMDTVFLTTPCMDVVSLAASAWHIRTYYRIVALVWKCLLAHCNMLMSVKVNGFHVQLDCL